MTDTKRPRLRLPVVDNPPAPQVPAPPPVRDEPPVREADLPELGDALVDPATLEQLFVDLEHATQILSVAVKERGARRANPGAVTLASARERLLAGDVAGIQIRYLYAGGEWWDTLLRTGAGVRIIRIRHDP